MLLGCLAPAALFLAAEITSRENASVAAGGRSVTWKLKEGVKWADGEPFAAQDVLFTYDYVTGPEVGAATGFTYEMVERVEAIDDHTVKAHFKEVNPAWALPFVGPTGMIIPRHIFAPHVGSNAAQAPANRLAVGTGAYAVHAFKEEDTLIIGDDVVSTTLILYEINPHYRDPDKPNDLLIEDAALIPLVGRSTAFGLNNQIALGRGPTAWDVDVWDIADWRRR